MALRRGLQQYGSIMGHGGYLGPDYPAEYLRLSTEHTTTELTDAGEQDPSAKVIEMYRSNRYDEASGTLEFTPEQPRSKTSRPTTPSSSARTRPGTA